MKYIFNFFMGILIFSISSCSSNEDFIDSYQSPIDTNHKFENTQKDLGIPMKVSDFIELVKTKCTDIELDYLYSLNSNDTLYVHKQSDVNYPRLNESNVEIYKRIANGKISLAPLKIEPIIKQCTRGRAWGDITEYRIATIGVKSGYNSLLESDIYLLADVSYTYNLTKYIIEKEWGCNISVYASALDHPSVLLTFANQGSSAHPTDDITITYAVLGQVQLSAAFGDFGAGAAIDQVREYGSFIVGY